jgi:hypothetical protein
MSISPWFPSCQIAPLAEVDQSAKQIGFRLIAKLRLQLLDKRLSQCGITEYAVEEATMRFRESMICFS